MKACKECEYFTQVGPYLKCTGPHVAPNVISGQPSMELPNARYSGGSGLRRDIPPCGTEGYHWKQRTTEPEPPSSRHPWYIKGLVPLCIGQAVVIVLLAAELFKRL